MNAIDFKEEYAKKLQMPEWDQFRSLTINRNGPRCQHCSAKTHGSLHVHHKGYIAGREPWEYGPHEVEVLCDECHGRLHREADRIYDTVDHMHESIGQIVAMSCECYLFDGMLPATHAWFGWSNFLTLLFGHREVPPDYWLPIREKGADFDRRGWKRKFKNTLLRHRGDAILMASIPTTSAYFFREPARELVVDYFWSEALKVNTLS